MRSLPLVTILAVLTLASPAALATWRAAGSFEPDTPYDQGWQRLEPDVDPNSGRLVYFNGVQISTTVMVNPNVGALETRVRNVGGTSFEALLGVWKDCNQDGYVGLAESAARDYRAELFDVTDVCPVDPAPYSHNDGEWVIEMIPIGMVEPCEYRDAPNRTLCGNADPFSPNPVVLYANETFLWGDIGAPGEVPPTECPTSPPQGTFSGTGAMVKWFDCFATGRIAQTVNANAPEDMRFEDPRNPQWSDSPLNVVFPVTLWGNPYQGGTGLLEQGADDRAFTVFDCSDPKGGADVRDPTADSGERGQLSVLNVEDPTGGPLGGRHDIEGVGWVALMNEDYDGDGVYETQTNFTDDEGSYASLPTFAPSVDNPTGSYWDSLEETQDGVQYSLEGTVLARPADCDMSSNNTAHLLYTDLEGGAPPTLNAKARNSFVFTFFDGTRGFPPAGSRTPADLGVPYLRETAVVRFVGGTWRASTSYSYDPQVVDRTTLQPAGAYHVSFYGRMDPSIASQMGLSLPRPDLGIYGEESCGDSIGEGQPDQNGWVCDPTRWFLDAEGNDNTPRYSSVEGEEGVKLGQAVGALYNLRDVDCYDGTLVAPVRASGALVAGACA